ncbi:hypothetical protein O3J91_06685 [Yersinia pestis]|nr:hypothetical protein [Yersinia pestis]MDL1129174.1 hypothetical protein [Yersinia pestis]
MNVVKIDSKKEDYRKNMKELKRIFLAIQLSSRRHPAPKAMFAVWMALASSLCCLLVWKFINPVFGYMNIFTSALVVGFVYVISYKMNHRSDSWVREIDTLLVAYSPLDRDRYRELQSHTNDYGIDTDYLLTWIDTEIDLIQKRLGKKREINFIKRKI